MLPCETSYFSSRCIYNYEQMNWCQFVDLMQLYGSGIFSSGIWHCITRYLVPDIFKTNFILKFQLQIHVVMNSCNCVPLYTWLNPWSRALLQKLIGPQIFKKFLTSHGIQRFITSQQPSTHPYPVQMSLVNTLHFSIFKIYFNTILALFPVPCMPYFPPISFPTVCIFTLQYVRYQLSTLISLFILYQSSLIQFTELVCMYLF